MNTGVTIREAVPEDIEEIIDTHARAWHAAYPGLLPDEFLAATGRDYFEKLWKRQISGDCPDKGYVAEMNGRIVGIMRCGPDSGGEPGAGELHQVYLVPEVHGLGIGKALIKKSMQVLSGMGYKSMNILVVAANDKACGAYVRGGARLKETRRMAFSRGGKTVHGDMAIYTVPNLAEALAKLEVRKAPHNVPMLVPRGVMT